MTFGKYESNIIGKNYSLTNCLTKTLQSFFLIETKYCAAYKLLTSIVFEYSPKKKNKALPEMVTQARNRWPL